MRPIRPGLETRIRDERGVAGCWSGNEGPWYLWVDRHRQSRSAAGNWVGSNLFREERTRATTNVAEGAGRANADPVLVVLCFEASSPVDDCVLVTVRFSAVRTAPFDPSGDDIVAHRSAARHSCQEPLVRATAAPATMNLDLAVRDRRP